MLAAVWGDYGGQYEGSAIAADRVVSGGAGLERAGPGALRVGRSPASQARHLPRPDRHSREAGRHENERKKRPGLPAAGKQEGGICPLLGPRAAGTGNGTGCSIS